MQHSDEGERRFAAWGDGLDFYFGKGRQIGVVGLLKNSLCLFYCVKRFF